MSNRIFLTVSAVALAVGLWGCASSERMSRMSGGVLQEYSAPQDRRIRSEKFQKHTKQHEKARSDFVGKVEETPVNVWPFFFSSEYYTTILWPFIDWDEYGFAVRPFYNMEGDEHSILFPLSAWNVADRDGWVLLFNWDKDGWMFFPFAARSETKDELLRYYTPLFIQHKDLRPLDLKHMKQESFTEFMLGYHSGERKLDDAEWSWKFWNARELDDGLRRYLAYKCPRAGVLIPTTMAELKEVRKEVAAKLPVKEKESVGFIPLFDVTWSENSYLWRALAYLVGGENSVERGFRWDVLGPIGMYYENEPPPTPWQGLGSQSSDRSFVSIVLMSFFSRETTFVDEGKYKLIRKLYSHAWTSDEEFARDLPDIRNELKQLDPALELPDTVTDGDVLKLYLDELGKTEKFRNLDLPVYRGYTGFFLPLFFYKESENPKEDGGFFSLVGMTYWSRGEKSRSFWSIPILTFAGKDETEEHLYVAPPLGWISKTGYKKRIEVPIHAANTRWAKDDDCASVRGDYSLCGLFYRGAMTYYAAKPGVNYQTAEIIRKRLPQLFDERKHYVENKAALEEKYQKEEAYRPKPNDEVDALKKQLNLAELRRDLRKLELEETGRVEEYAQLRQKAAKLGVALEEKFPEKREEIDAALERLFDAAAELHSQSDAGSGFFYRKELSHNGDYNWHCLGFLAGGEKTGDREHTHVLQFLYRFRRDGKRTEKICFPFISIREDEHGSRTSVMGRVWQKTVKDGRTSGYVFFIPYGEH
jgi:hypothetical protein